MVWPCKNIEITTMGGHCPINCQVCPQSTYASKYKGIKEMPLELFNRALVHIPLDTLILFSGFFEPFVNRNAITMIESAFNKGYTVALNTTLVGLSLEDLDRLARIRFDYICVHLPDNQGCARIPNTAVHAAVLNKALRTLTIDGFSVMNSKFRAHTRAGLLPGPRRYVKGPLFCDKLNFPQFIMLPNGTLVLCCMDFGLLHPVGNILHQDLDTIFLGEPMNEIRHKARLWDSDLLCRTCEFAQGFRQHAFYASWGRTKRAAKRLVPFYRWE